MRRNTPVTQNEYFLNDGSTLKKNIFWVHANVTPVWQDETLTGYISVRNIPSREEIAASDIKGC